MSTLIPITQTADGRHAVAGRALHAFLEIQTPYHKWFPRMVEYGFTAGQDYTDISVRVAREGRGAMDATDHILTLDMGKEVSMIQRNEKGRQARQYFIECEKQAKAPAPALTEEEVVHQALQITYRKVQELEARAAEDAPKVAYHDEFVCDDDAVTIATVASRLDITQKRLRELLIEHGWIFKETRMRWSQKRAKKVPMYRYSEAASKKSYFLRKPEHDAPRFGSQVMHTLLVTSEGVAPVIRAVRRWLAGEEVQEQTDVEGVPVEDAAPGELPPAA